MGKRRAFGTILRRQDRAEQYYIRFNYQGRRLKRRAGKTWKTANRKLAKVETLIERGSDLDDILAEVFQEVRGRKLTFRQVIPKYQDFAKGRKTASTMATDTRRFRMLCKASWSSKPLPLVKPRDIARWMKARNEKDGASGATVNRDVNLASAVFEWAIKEELARENPVRKVKKFSERGRGREAYLTPEEARGLIAAAEAVFRPFLTAALFTGMRQNELLSLKWRDVDFGRRLVVVDRSTAKTGRTRPIYMSGRLESELRDLKVARVVTTLGGRDPLFTLPDGSPLTENRVRRMFERALRRCKAIPREKKPSITFHVLRHTAASLLQKAGVPLSDVGRILGHANLQTTLRYAHLYSDSTRPAIEKLDQVVGLGPDESRGVEVGA